MERKQFIYTLKLIPPLLDPNNWTDRENQIVDNHFSRLSKLLKDDKLILAGRTQTMDENTFGIVILQVETEEEAIQLMNHDPTVKEGIMTAELYPYKVALYNHEFRA
ncbi:MAG: YciI family protein [Heyndrickxia sp.]